MTRVYLGVDPGLTGALAWYEPAVGTLDVIDMPTSFGKSKRFVEPSAISNWLSMSGAAHARYIFGAVELVHAAPDQGVASMFNFGMGFGMVLGVLAAHAIPYKLVPPEVWKIALNVPADKDAAIRRATELLPAHARNWPLKKHHGRAEAALIALWGSRQQA